MILHMGCGETRLEDAVNVDLIPTSAADIVYDLSVTPWPTEWAPDEHFDQIEAIDVLEHFVHVMPVMQEMYRVLKPGGQIHIHTTYWNTKNSFTDPTHHHYFTEHSFDYWDPSTEWGRKYHWYRHGSGELHIEHATAAGQELDVLLTKPGVPS